MKIEGWLFVLGTVFYAVVAVVYWFMTGEVVGTTVLALTAGLAAIIGFYILFTGSRVGVRPEDRLDADIDEADPDYGFFSPHSWWPMPIGIGAMLTAFGLVFAVWLLLLGIGVIMFGVIGMVFEYEGQDAAH